MGKSQRASRWIRRAPAVGAGPTAAAPGLPEQPLCRLAGLRQRLRRAGTPHLFVAEAGQLGPRLKRRVLRLAWSPMAAGSGRPVTGPAR